MSASNALNVVKSTSGVVPLSKKYTLKSHGIWERIRRLFAIDPSRSNGIPLNPQYRNPPPGSNPPFSFIDPVTTPAGDIADNPYWKRDSRRSYPQMSVITQRDTVGLLRLGNRNSPKQELLGNSGTQALIEVEKESEAGLAAYFKKEGKPGTLTMLGMSGLPPLPSGASLQKDAGKYQLTEQNAYPKNYPCRTFH